MKWLQQKWYDVSIRTKSILLMGMMLAVTWVLVALVMIQLHTFSERSSVIMDEYMDITGFMDAFSAENASLEAYMRPIQPIDAKEDYLAAIQMTNRCLEELCKQTGGKNTHSSGPSATQCPTTGNHNMFCWMPKSRQR